MRKTNYAEIQFLSIYVYACNLFELYIFIVALITYVMQDKITRVSMKYRAIISMNKLVIQLIFAPICPIYFKTNFALTQHSSDLKDFFIRPELQ